MRNGYNQQHKGTTFRLPNLCSKPSMINDVHVPAAHSSGRCSSDDPSLSPKVGCMGQVKKKNLQQQQQQNYKQLGMVFPTTSTTSTNNYPNNSTAAVGFRHSNFSYSKLLRLFSSKTLLTTPSVLATATKTKTNITTATTSCSTRKSHLHHHQNRLRSRSCEDGAIGFESTINVADLDPPLPVIIKKKTTSAASLVSDGDNNNNSLWKRRSGGAALKGLQIQLSVCEPHSKSCSHRKCTSYSDKNQIPSLTMAHICPHLINPAGWGAVLCMQSVIQSFPYH